MEYGVRWQGREAGRIQIAEEGQNIRFTVDCELVSEEVLRCYGVTGQAGEPLRIGVMEPAQGRLRCERSLARRALPASGIPRAYYLDDGAHPQAANRPPAFWTGDRLLDEALRAGEVLAAETLSGLRLTCPFAPRQPFPLAFAFAACHAVREEGQTLAVLRLDGPYYRILCEENRA